MSEPLLVPARMLNELAYCPRLFALEWVHGEWADSADTVEGRTVHRRVDRPTRAGLGEEVPELRSVSISDEGLGIIAKIDLVDIDGGEVVPVDYKKGEAPVTDDGAWEPERVQVAAQVMLLRANGFRAPHGELWFAASRRRVRVEVDDALQARVIELRDRARSIAGEQALPPPLEDSPKCRGCSLVGICLPDETNLLTERASTPPRTLVSGREDQVPLYVRLQGGSLGKDHEELVVRDKGVEVGRARIAHTSRVVLLGNASVTTAALGRLAQEDVPLAVHSAGGWFQGTFWSAHGRNVAMRMAQHRAAADPGRALVLARRLVEGKIANQRVLLRRNGRAPEETLTRMRELGAALDRAEDLGVLMGLEGVAARLYFEQFPTMLKGDLATSFAWEGRNRRPPRDPINALLSFVYAVLVREYTVILHEIGLDPYVGFLHQPRPGRPALALDLMEELRPVLGDSCVINAVNNGVVGNEDFLVHPTGCALQDAGRRRFIELIERRLDETILHPVFGTKMSYRRVIEVQARLLGRTVLGEIERFPPFKVR